MKYSKKNARRGSAHPKGAGKHTKKFNSAPNPSHGNFNGRTAARASGAVKRNARHGERGSKAFDPKTALTGTVEGNERGFAFIIPDQNEHISHDFFVPPRRLNGAFHGDRVLFAPVRGTDDEAVILSVISRNPAPFVGTLCLDRRSAYVRPDDVRLPVLSVPLSLTYGARSGDKVMCEVTSYPKDRRPSGKVLEILGEEGELFAEELSIIRAHGLKEKFGEGALKEARAVCGEKICADGRKDMRGKLAITIDCEDTRDMDDAVGLEKSADGFTLYVHIADVAHYVERGGELDSEAYERGTSVYFPDRVLPMLPAELSNGACSLNEGEDRYALTCEIYYSPAGERQSFCFYESVIKSCKKTSYPLISALLESGKKGGYKKTDDTEKGVGENQFAAGGSGENAKAEEALRELKKDDRLCKMCGDMLELSGLLSGARKEKGFINLELNEPKIYLDDGGRIVIPKAERGVAEDIIEQFMISANECAAEFLRDEKVPCLYRVHESPAPEKAESFCEFLKALGINADLGENPTPLDYRKVLDGAAKTPYKEIICSVALRSMQKAKYSGENLGHFGIASDCYCHFTSPIRRYPDLFVQRCIKDILHKNAEKAKTLYSPLLAAAGEDCSASERRADDAERAVDDLYKLEYMSDKLGEEFLGKASGVTEFGVFVKLENGVEGLIPSEDLPPDVYTFFPERFLLKGKRHAFALGDEIKIMVAACDLGRMRVIFALA